MNAYMCIGCSSNTTCWQRQQPLSFLGAYAMCAASSVSTMQLLAQNTPCWLASRSCTVAAAAGGGGREPSGGVWHGYPFWLPCCCCCCCKLGLLWADTTSFTSLNQLVIPALMFTRPLQLDGQLWCQVIMCGDAKLAALTSANEAAAAGGDGSSMAAAKFRLLLTFVLASLSGSSNALRSSSIIRCAAAASCQLPPGQLRHGAAVQAPHSPLSKQPAAGKPTQQCCCS